MSGPREHVHGACRPASVEGPTIRFRLNGRDREVTSHPDDSALDLLRERCGLISPKDGCSPQGQCGCCLVLVDGHPRVTCAMKAEKVQGKSITTLEGLPQEERDLWASAFVAAAGLQCGFCIPGIVMRGKAILDERPNASRKEIAKHLDVHLCRCTGYTKILDAIELVGRVKRGEATVPPLETDGHVGKSLARYQGLDLAMGDRPYVDDLRLPDMLEGAVLQSAHARATIRAIDTRAAEAVPGVVAVVTAKDVPGQNRVGIFYEDWPPFIGVGMTTSTVGDVIAAVAAIDEHTARKAAALIEVDYDVHEPIVDPEASLAPGAPRINATHENELGKSIIVRGDADAALAKCAHVVHGTWKTQRVEHLYLEPESCVAYPNDRGGVKLFTQGQGIFDDRRQVAKVLGVPEDDVEVELVPNGGAFGGKEDMSIQAQTALLARTTGRAVKIALTREESVRLHPKRHPITMHYTVGADAAGKIVAVKARMLGDSGAYASVGSKVLERAAGHACGAYDVANVDVVAIAAYTNNVPCGAFRGFGANQAQFAMEGAVDMLAEKMGRDPWDLRFQNAVDVGSVFASGQVFEKSVGLKKTLLAIKPHYDAAKAAGKACGLACGIKNSGIGNGALEWGKVRLVVDSPDQVSLYNGYTEMGQGLLTVLIQCAVEATNLPASVFRAKVDSTYQLGCGQTTGSRATLLGGRAVVVAARKMRADLDGTSAASPRGGPHQTTGSKLSDLVGKVYEGDELIDDTTKLGHTPKPGLKLKTHTAFGFATQLVILDRDGKLEKVVAAHDVGRAINPALCAGQIEGSVHMGLGYALTEELPCDAKGMPVTFSMRDIGPLRAKDTPDIEVILVEDYEPEGPYGAKGVGEIGLVPTAPAVQGALYAFDKVRRFTLPMKDSPAAKAMGVGKIKKPAATTA